MVATKACQAETSRPCADVIDKCHWDCSQINVETQRSGKDAITIFKACNRVFEAVVEAGEEAPFCGMEYLNQQEQGVVNA